MDAMISGRTGVAVILEGKALKSFDVDAPTVLVPRRESDIHFIFGDAKDIQILENTNLDEARQKLEQEYNCACALDLALISLDADLPDDIRQEAVEGLEELLDDAKVLEKLESILYGKPLPVTAEIFGALECCKTTDAAKAEEMFHKLLDRQVLIQDVCLAWDAIPSSRFSDYQYQSEFYKTLVNAGIVRSLVLALGGNESIDTFLFTALIHPDIRVMKNHRDVLQEWVKPFKQTKAEINLSIEEPDELEDLEPKEREKRIKRVGALTALENVTRRKEFILRQLRSRKFYEANRAIEELIEYQIKVGGTKHLVKSLCDLAMVAKDLGLYPLQLELTERSINLEPDDAWSWAQYGDALLNANRLSEALDAYEQALAFGEDVVAKTGRAEILKAQGKLSEALIAYESAMKDHPENVVAKTGRAEILKAQGNFSEALIAYESAMKDHPENAVAKNGRAEILKAQGKLSEALIAYESAMKDHPEDVVAKNGRAEILKAQGNFSEALEAYESAMKDHPEDVVAKTGRAEILKAQGKLSEALEAYESAMKDHPEDVVAKTGRAEILKAQGNFSEALEAYESAMKDHPENAVAKNGRAEILKAQGNFSEALEAYESAMKDHPEDVVAKTGRAEILKAQGKLSEALEAYESAMKDHPENAVAKTGRAEILKAQGKLSEALEAYESAMKDHPEDAVAKNGRAEILKAQGKLSEALIAYESAMKDHPENAVAKTGRAEILKAQGNFSEALVAYESVINEHPEDTVAKNGRLGILAALRRYDEVLKAIPDAEPATKQDWIRYHIKGTVLLRMGRIDEAIKIFEYGVTTNPLSYNKEYFCNALGVAWLRQEKFKEAAKVLENVKSPLLQPQANILRLHSFGELGERENAIAVYNDLNINPQPALQELKDELYNRFILEKETIRDKEWILEQEVNMLLLGINQQEMFW